MPTAAQGRRSTRELAMFLRPHRISFIAIPLMLTFSACRETTMPEVVATDPAFANNGGKGNAITAPKNLTATSIGSYSVSLAWEPSTVKSGTFEYRVRVDRGSVYH